MSTKLASPEQIRLNVLRWRREHQMEAPKPRQGKFRNEPRVLKLSQNNVVIDLNRTTGEAVAK